MRNANGAAGATATEPRTTPSDSGGKPQSKPDGDSVAAAIAPKESSDAEAAPPAETVVDADAEGNANGDADGDAADDDAEDVDAELEAMKQRLKEMEEESNAVTTAAASEAKAADAPSASASAAPAAAAAAGAVTESDARSIYVGNVDYAATPEELQAHFADCGTINRVTIMCNKMTGAPKGFAYIEFVDEDAVQNAIILNESPFRGRQLKVTPKRTNIPGMNYRGGYRGGYRGRGGWRPRGYGYRGRGRGRWVPY